MSSYTTRQCQKWVHDEYYRRLAWRYNQQFSVGDLVIYGHPSIESPGHYGSLFEVYASPFDAPSLKDAIGVVMKIQLNEALTDHSYEASFDWPILSVNVFDQPRMTCTPAIHWGILEHRERYRK